VHRIGRALRAAIAVALLSALAEATAHNRSPAWIPLPKLVVMITIDGLPQEQVLIAVGHLD